MPALDSLTNMPSSGRDAVRLSAQRRARSAGVIASKARSGTNPAYTRREAATCKAPICFASAAIAGRTFGRNIRRTLWLQKQKLQERVRKICHGKHGSGTDIAALPIDV